MNQSVESRLKKWTESIKMANCHVKLKCKYILMLKVSLFYLIFYFGTILL